MDLKGEPRGLEWDGAALSWLDQTQLPLHEEVVRSTDWRDVVGAIKVLAIRGAPAIGVAGAFAALLAWREMHDREAWQQALITIENARPTAVNLSHAVRAMLSVSQGVMSDRMDDVLSAEAERIAREDSAMCERMADLGLELVKQGTRALTHCNTGALVTYGIGTALGVLRRGHERGLVDHVYACEARPLGQGARLTMWELDKLGIPSTLLTDSAAGRLMQEGRVDLVMLGADRIAANGDTANKVGTLNLALIARRFDVPFYVVAPSTTLDTACASGQDIRIEYRGEEEVRRCGSRLHSLPDVAAFNPAFDITPSDLVTAFVFEDGVRRPPYHFERDGKPGGNGA